MAHEQRANLKVEDVLLNGGLSAVVGPRHDLVPEGVDKLFHAVLLHGPNLHFGGVDDLTKDCIAKRLQVRVDKRLVEQNSDLAETVHEIE